MQLNVLHASVGGITESDVMLASASNAIIIGFNVRPESKATTAAEREGVDVRLYTVIYDAINDVRDAMEGLLEPTYKREDPRSRRGARDLQHPGRRHDRRLLRHRRQDHPQRAGAPACATTSSCTTARSAACGASRTTCARSPTGYECGIGLDNFNDVKAGDIIEAYEMEQVARRLEPAVARSAAAERSL